MNPHELEPGITVVIPAFNAQSVISNAVKSAWGAGALEVIVVDDGSSDDTAAVARNLGCVVIQQQNSGAAAARRAGVLRARGAFISLLDADDSLIAEGVRRSREIAETSDKWAIIFGRTVGVTANGGQSVFNHWIRQVTPTRLVKAGFSPAPPAALLWNGVRLREAMFDHTPAVWPRYAEDYELFIRGSMRGVVISHDVPTARYALEGGKSTKDPRQSLRASETIRRHYAALLGVRIRPRGERALTSRSLLRTAKSLDSVGDQAARVKLLARAAYLDPSFIVGFIASGVYKRVRWVSKARS